MYAPSIVRAHQCAPLFSLSRFLSLCLSRSGVCFHTEMNAAQEHKSRQLMIMTPQRNTVHMCDIEILSVLFCELARVQSGTNRYSRDRRRKAACARRGNASQQWSAAAGENPTPAVEHNTCNHTSRLHVRVFLYANILVAMLVFSFRTVTLGNPWGFRYRQPYPCVHSYCVHK